MGWIRRRPDRPTPWRAGYRGPDGREHSKAFGRKVDAERWLRDELQKQDRGLWVDPTQVPSNSKSTRRSGFRASSSSPRQWPAIAHCSTRGSCLRWVQSNCDG